MKIILASSKTMKPRETFCDPCATVPIFNSEAEKIVDSLGKMPLKELSELLKCNLSLAKGALDSFQRFQIKDEKRYAALALFSGQVFSQIEVEKMSRDDWAYASKSIIIVSGLFGFLRSTDQILPYRLEMASKLPSMETTLGEFWAKKLTSSLEKNECLFSREEEILNLASEEYSQPFRKSDLGQNLVKVEFLEKVGGKFKVIGVHAKKARGKMTNYIIQNKIQTSNDIKAFSEAGYEFSEEESEKMKIVFCRN